MISINNITKKYKENLVLDDVSIKFEKNISFIFGNNGVGKSTLINIIAGAVFSENGNIYIDNEKVVFSNGTYKKKIGFLLSFPTYPKHYKVSEYIDLINFIYSIDKIKKSQFQEDLIIFFGLNKYLNTQINELSVGYIKRVQLLASMLHEPKHYIYDEPYSGLDEDFIPHLNKKIIELSNEGKTFIIATHHIENNIFNNLNSDQFKISKTKIQKLIY